MLRLDNLTCKCGATLVLGIYPSEEYPHYIDMCTDVEEAEFRKAHRHLENNHPGLEIRILNHLRATEPINGRNGLYHTFRYSFEEAEEIKSLKGKKFDAWTLAKIVPGKAIFKQY